MSCLFQSLSKFVSHQNYNKLRQDICDFLSTNPTLYEGIDLKTITELDNNSVENYVNHMRSNAVWGGAPEIKSFCEMYKVNVIVKNIRGGNINEDITFSCNTPTNRWVVISWNGGHFEPVLYHDGENKN